MATEYTLTLLQNNDPKVRLRVREGSAPYDLTDKRVEVLVKETVTTDDAAALYVLSTETGEVTIEDAAAGTAIADFEGVLSDAGTFWYDAYVADEASADLNRQTFKFGPLVVQAV